MAAAAALAAAHRLVAAVGLHACALPRSTLPSPEGFFGRLSTLAAGLGLPAGRLTLAGLVGQRRLAAAGLPVGPVADIRLVGPACSQPVPPWPFSPSSVLLRMSLVPAPLLPGRLLATLSRFLMSLARSRIELSLFALTLFLMFVAVELVELVAVDLDLARGRYSSSRRR